MADWYVDPAASGDNDGGADGAADDPTDTDNWTHAWDNLQSAFDNASAGDTVYCRGTQTLTAPLDADGNDGSVAGGYIKFIGCNNGLGGITGEYFTLDGDSKGVTIGIRDNGTVTAYYWFENIQVTDCSEDGWQLTAGSYNWVWVNCKAYDNGDCGWNVGTSSSSGTFVRCIADTNGESGFYNLDNEYACYYCVAANNTDDGFHCSNIRNLYVGCISHDNGSSGDRGYYLWYQHHMVNCIADGEVTGVLFVGDRNCVMGSRFTNNATGVDFSNELVLMGWNLFESSSSADMANPAATGTAYALAIPHDADADTNEIDPDSGDDGYNNTANNDFNLKAAMKYNGDGNDTIDMNIGS